MIKKITLAVLLMLGFMHVSAQNIELVSDKGNTITITNANPPEVALPIQEVNGQYYLGFGSNILIMEKGAPALPVYRTSVMVKNGGSVTLEVSYDSFTEMSNQNILPSKGSLTRNINPANVAFEQGPAYYDDAFYPGSLAEISSPYNFRETRGVTVSFYPYQYNPVTKKLRVYKNITVKVVAQGDKRAEAITNSAFSKIYSNFYLNGKAKNAKTLNENEGPQPAEMLIIAPDEYVEAIAPLADWKIQSGLKTTVVTLSETGPAPEDIKGFIANFYEESPNLTYVLLVGDHENLPCYTYGLTGASEELWSDSYYGQLEGEDFYPELLVGRFSGTVEGVENMVNRTLEYETAPLEGDWMTRFVGIGSNEGDGYGDDGEPDWQHLRNIGDKLLDYGYTQGYEFFDGSHGGNDLDDSPFTYMLSDAVNDGVGLINYTGHGATEVFATTGFSNGNVSDLFNNGKYPFIVSVACNNGTFTNGTSICEAWVDAQNFGSPSGAVAACGSSILMAWAEPIQTQDEITEIIVGGTADRVKHTLGGLFYNGQLSMLQTYGESETATQVMQTWVFFGDPSVVYRNAPNQELAITHPQQVSSTATAITVGANVEGAVVAITQNGVIIGIATVVNGQAVVQLTDFDPSLPLTITATMQNYTPYQGTVATTLGNEVFGVNSIPLYPNPAGAQLTVSHNLNGAAASYKIYDVTGKVIFTGNVPVGDSFSVNTSHYASGVYLLTVQSEGGSYTRKFIKQ